MNLTGRLYFSIEQDGENVASVNAIFEDTNLDGEVISNGLRFLFTEWDFCWAYFCWKKGEKGWENEYGEDYDFELRTERDTTWLAITGTKDYSLTVETCLYEKLPSLEESAKEVLREALKVPYEGAEIFKDKLLRTLAQGKTIKFDRRYCLAGEDYELTVYKSGPWQVREGNNLKSGNVEGGEIAKVLEDVFLGRVLPERAVNFVKELEGKYKGKAYKLVRR